MVSRRFGTPRTTEERLFRHRLLFGEEALPPRGTGFLRGTAAQGSISGPLGLWSFPILTAFASRLTTGMSPVKTY